MRAGPTDPEDAGAHRPAWDGEVWEVDLDEPGPPGGGAGPPGGGASGDGAGWHRASLSPSRDVQAVGHAGSPGQGLAAPAGLRGRRGALLGLAGIVGLLLVVPGLGGERAQAPDPAEATQPGGTAVLRGGLAAPLEVAVPPELTRVAQGLYVGLRSDDRGHVLVTTPTEVVDASGRRVPVPADAASWLRAQPSVHVTRARIVPVAGRRAVQVDYRLAEAVRTANPRRSTSLSLFCGLWDGNRETSPCSRVTADARVRATFVQVGERLLLLEAIWSASAAPDGQMPQNLRRGYWQLLRNLRLEGTPIVAT